MHDMLCSSIVHTAFDPSMIQYIIQTFAPYDEHIIRAIAPPGKYRISQNLMAKHFSIGVRYKSTSVLLSIHYSGWLIGIIIMHSGVS